MRTQDRGKTPNLVLRHVREAERRETREEFAAALVQAGRRLGEPHLGCDARLVARWEDGEVTCPRPAYQRALEALTGRPFADLGFRQRNAIGLPSPNAVAPARLSFEVDEGGHVWAIVDRRRFLVGTSAALLAQAGLVSTDGRSSDLPALRGVDSFEFSAFATQRWPELRLARPQPDYGVDYTALLPANRAIEGGSLQIQLHGGENADGRIIARVQDWLRWEEFLRCGQRGLLVAASSSPGHSRFFAMDSREARRRAGRHETRAVVIPAAYELDDVTFALLWACASLDAGLQADDQELTVARGELAPYENLPSSAVSREAAAELGQTSQMWLGSDFCACHILRHLEFLPAAPVFWTREQSGAEACPWLLFDHKQAYLHATRERFGDEPLSRMFCIPSYAVSSSPLFERILLFLSIALMEAVGIQVKICDDAGYSNVEGFVLGGPSQAIIANWVRGEGIWHVDTARRASVLADFREAVGFANAHSVVQAHSPAARLRAVAHYLELDWSWLQRRCRQLARVGTADLIRPRSRHVSTTGVDIACSFVGQPELSRA